MEKAKSKSKTYKNVMPRVSSQSDTNLKPKYVVTRHPIVRSGAKPISSANSSGFCDLPVALNDYTAEPSSDKRRTFVVKPRKTIKSLPPAVPPSFLKTRNSRANSNIFSRFSAPTVLSVPNSRSVLNRSTKDLKLQKLKDEIKAYHEEERNIKFSDSLHKKFGFKLSGDGEVAVDKGIQVEGKDSHSETLRKERGEDAGAVVPDQQMRPALPEYPVDRYLVQNNINKDLDNIINEDLWESEPALRPEDEKTLRKLHEMLRSTTDDLKVLSDELARQREHGIRVKSTPTPLDEEFNEKVHIEEVVSAKFFGHKIPGVQNSMTPSPNVQKDVVDGLIKTIAEKQKVKHVTTKAVQVSESPVKRNLVKSQTRVFQVNHEKEKENIKNNERYNLNTVSRIGYSEYSYKYEESKPSGHMKKNLQVQKLPKVNIRSELKIQNVLNLDILPDDANKSTLQNVIKNNSNLFIVKHQSDLAKADRLGSLQSVNPVASQIRPVKKTLDRKISKLQTCESSESTEHMTSDFVPRLKAQKQFKRVRYRSPATLIGCKTQGKTKNVSNTTGVSLDEWRNKLNSVYGSGIPKVRKGSRMQSNPKNLSVIEKTNTVSKEYNKKGLNNTEYIPYSKLTIGGVSLDEIEKEISDLPDKNEKPLGPILEKILSSRENTISLNSPRINKQNTKNVLTTSDENLLKDVLDIHKKVSKSLQEEKKESADEENDTYADDFDDDKTDSSYHISPRNVSNKSLDNEGCSKESKTNNSPITDEEKIEFKIQNETFTKANSLSFKNSVDVFEYVHEIDTQDSGTQISLNKKMSRKQTQTSPRPDKNNIQSIHNDLKSTDPLAEVENMFTLEKEFIKKLIIDEYGDIFTNAISKPSTSRHVDSKINENSTQKDTQTSPARMKSMMTSPKRTKTRTTSPFVVSKVDRPTSPIPATSYEDHQNDCDDISINLSSPRFSLRLPQTSRDVMSNLDTKLHRKQQVPIQSRKKLTSSSSSSVDEYSSSDISNWGQIEKYKKMYRKLKLSTTEDSSSPTPRRSELSEMPLKSEGEISLGQIRRKVRKSKDSKSEGEASIGELLRRARK